MKPGKTHIIKKGSEIWSESKGTISIEEDLEIILETVRGYMLIGRSSNLGVVQVHKAFLKESE